MKPIEIRVVRIETVSEAPTIVAAQKLLSIVLQFYLTRVYYGERGTGCQHMLCQTFFDYLFPLLLVFYIFQCASDIKEFNIQLICSFNYCSLDNSELLHRVRVALGKNWDDVGELLDDFCRYEILVFWMMTVKEEQYKVDACINNFLKTPRDHLIVAIELRVNILA